MTEWASEREYVASQKGALVGWHLAHGECMTTEHVAQLTGLTWEGARVLMCKISIALPIVRVDGAWQVAGMAECRNLDTQN